MKVAHLLLFLIISLNLFRLTFPKIETYNEKETEKYTSKSNFFIILIIFIPLIYFFFKNRKDQKNFQKYIEQENSKPINYINNNDEIRGNYSKYISKKRRKQKTPKKLVDEKGKIIFGTFESEFEEMDLLKAKGPTRLPNFFNKYKLTLWEVGEVNWCFIRSFM